MAIDVNWVTGLITVPRADMPVVQVSPEIRSFDVVQFHKDLRTIHASVQGAPYSTTHLHGLPYTISGTNYADSVNILDPYTVEFEDGQYTVLSFGANHNVGDVKVPNQVSLITNNSAGLINIVEIRELLYDGAINIDAKNGTDSGSYPYGTLSKPCKTLANANDLNAFFTFDKFRLRGSLNVAGEDLDDTVWEGNGEEAELNLGVGANCADAEFFNLKLTGTMTQGPVRARDCDINGANGLHGSYVDCALLAGTHALGGDTRFVRPSSAVPGPGQPELDFAGGDYALELRDQSGGVRVKNMSHADSKLSIDAPSAHVVIDLTCTNGNGVIRGGGKLDRLDTMRVGGTIDDSGFRQVELALIPQLAADSLLNSILDSYTVSESVAESLQQLFTILALSSR